MTETEYNEIAAEIFESAMWTIKFTLDAKKSTDEEKLSQIKTIVTGAFKRIAEEEHNMLCDEE